MKLSIQAGATSQTVNIFVRDSSSTTGGGLTGLVYNTSSLVAYYALPKAAAVAITLATLAAVTSVYSSGGFKEIDATNMPGWYRFDIPDAAIASGRFVSLHFKGATNMAPTPVEIELTAWNNQDAVRGGLTALPNAAASAVGGLPVAVDTSGRVDVLKINGTSQTARDIGASVLLSAGTGTGQLDFTSGVVKANLAQILGTALTETAGLLAGGFKQFFNISSPTSTMNTITAVTTATNLTNAPTAGDLTATMKTSVTTAATAATPSVTVSDKTGFSLSTAGILAIWHQLTAAVVTASTMGKLIVDYLDAAVSSRTKPADTQARVTLVDTVTTYTGNTPQTGDSYARIGVNGAGLTAAPDTAGTTTLLSRLSSGRAAALDYLDGAISGIAASVWAAGARTLTAFGFTVTAATVADKTGYALTGAYDPAKTAAQASDVPSANANADALLKRDWTAVSGEASKSLLNALRGLGTINKVVISGGVATVYKEDGTTIAYTIPLTTDAGAEPVTGTN